MVNPSGATRDDLPSEVWAVLLPAFKVGIVSGCSGALFGSIAGILRSTTPVLFAVASGIQWFTLGSSFWATRGAVIRAWDNNDIVPRDKIFASSIAGAVAGGTGGFLRGRRNIIPGMIIFSLFGAAGQTVYNQADAWHAGRSFSSSTSDDRKSWLDARWSPVTALSDEEYENILQEKLHKVDAEIALLDEDLARLKSQGGENR